MIPIFEQGTGQGIGYSIRTFVDRFDAICSERAEKEQGRAFAFIFYDFTNKAVRRILKDLGGFAKLDRLSGDKLSVFYLHPGTRGILDAFNSYFFTLLGIKDTVRLPCLVFFRVAEQKVRDIEIAQLDSADLIHGFTEIYGAIESYIRENRAAPSESSSLVRWRQGSTNVVDLDEFRKALRTVV